MTFGGPRVDAAVARELLRAVEPLAIEATFEAERMHRERQEDQRHIHDLELRQARYEASLAERRYAACDPDNRLIAAQQGILTPIPLSSDALLVSALMLVLMPEHRLTGWFSKIRSPLNRPSLVKDAHLHPTVIAPLDLSAQILGRLANDRRRRNATSERAPSNVWFGAGGACVWFHLVQRS